MSGSGVSGGKTTDRRPSSASCCGKQRDFSRRGERKNLVSWSSDADRKPISAESAKKADQDLSAITILLYLMSYVTPVCYCAQAETARGKGASRARPEKIDNFVDNCARVSRPPYLARFMPLADDNCSAFLTLN
jgi:hypothetical protein